MSKRKQPELRVVWSKREEDLLFHFNGQKADSHLIHSMLCAERLKLDGEFERSFVHELEARGYDVKTLRFSIRKKRTVDNETGVKP